MKELYQTAEWKKEKHVPAIELVGETKKGSPIIVNVAVGKEIAHPNTTEHHIRWIRLFFTPEGGKFPYEIGRIEFSAHGESVEGPDTSTVYSAPSATFVFTTERPGSLISSSYCNIHGLWQDEQKLEL